MSLRSRSRARRASRSRSESRSATRGAAAAPATRSTSQHGHDGLVVASTKRARRTSVPVVGEGSEIGVVCVVMPATLGAAAARSKRPREELRAPPAGGRRSSAGGRRARGAGLRSASWPLHDRGRPARRASSPSLDAALASAAFAVTLGAASARQAFGARRARGRLAQRRCSRRSPRCRSPRWRRSPLGVFALTTAASACCSRSTRRRARRSAPTIALFLLAAQPRRRASVDAAHDRGRRRRSSSCTSARPAPGESEVPAAPLLFGVLVWTIALVRRRSPPPAARAAGRAGAERARARAAPRGRPRSERGSPATCTTRPDTRSTRSSSRPARRGCCRTATRSARARRSQTIEEVARETIGEIDALVGALRDGAPADAGAAARPRPLATLVERHRARRPGRRAARPARAPRALPPTVDRAAYRIAQEALTNAARHGTGARRADAALPRRRAELTVANPVAPRRDGAAAGGHGLTGMRERAALLGGTLDARRVGGRFAVRATLPMARSGVTANADPRAARRRRRPHARRACARSSPATPAIDVVAEAERRRAGACAARRASSRPTSC